LMEYREKDCGWRCPYCRVHKHKKVMLLNWDGKPMSREERKDYWDT